MLSRRLCSQIPEEWLKRSSPETDLNDLVTEICKYCLHYSAEAEACDLLMEIEKIERIVDLVTEDISDRVCLYLTRSVERWAGEKGTLWSLESIDVIYKTTNNL